MGGIMASPMFNGNQRRNCRSKQKFLSRSKAEAYLARIGNSKRLNTLSIYKCSNCGHYHFTKMEGNDL